MKKFGKLELVYSDNLEMDKLIVVGLQPINAQESMDSFIKRLIKEKKAILVKGLREIKE